MPNVYFSALHVFTYAAPVAPKPSHRAKANGQNGTSGSSSTVAVAEESDCTGDSGMGTGSGTGPYEVIEWRKAMLHPPPGIYTCVYTAWHSLHRKRFVYYYDSTTYSTERQSHSYQPIRRETRDDGMSYKFHALYTRRNIYLLSSFYRWAISGNRTHMNFVFLHVTLCVYAAILCSEAFIIIMFIVTRILYHSALRIYTISDQYTEGERYRNCLFAPMNKRRI